MNTRLTQFLNHAMILLKNYNSKQHENEIHPFRITEIKEQDENISIIFQMIGKNVFLKTTIDEILQNDELTKRFPSTDIRTITKLSYEKKISEQQPTITIKSKSLDHELNKIMINFKDKNGTEQNKLASEIVLNNELIQQLSSKDAISIGYIAGYEHGNTPTTLNNTE